MRHPDELPLPQNLPPDYALDDIEELISQYHPQGLVQYRRVEFPNFGYPDKRHRACAVYTGLKRKSESTDHANCKWLLACGLAWAACGSTARNEIYGYITGDPAQIFFEQEWFFSLGAFNGESKAYAPMNGGRVPKYWKYPGQSPKYADLIFHESFAGHVFWCEVGLTTVASLIAPLTEASERFKRTIWMPFQNLQIPVLYAYHLSLDYEPQRGYPQFRFERPLPKTDSMRPSR
jgi:hypothetical protein